MVHGGPTAGGRSPYEPAGSPRHQRSTPGPACSGPSPAALLSLVCGRSLHRFSVRSTAATRTVSLFIALLTVSDSRSLADDPSGDALQQRLEAAGHRLVERTLVPDDRYRIRADLSRWIADPAVQVVISSGGTGLTGRDGTPEAVAPLLDKTIEGFGELFRVLSFETIGTSTLQSRALAGVANGTVVFVLPGSLDAVCTAWDRLIRAQLDATTRPCNLVQLLPRLTESPDQAP